MKQYLLSVHMVEGQPPPPPDEVQPRYDSVDVFNQELQDKGAWVFAGGLHPPDIATVVSIKNGEGTHHRRSLRRDQGAVRGILGGRSRGSRRRAGLGGEGEPGLRCTGRGSPVPRAPRGLEPFGALGRRRDLPPGVRTLGGHPGPLLRRHRRCRRSGAGGLPGRHRTLAGDRPPAEPRRVDHHHRPESSHRPSATRSLPP